MTCVPVILCTLINEHLRVHFIAKVSLNMFYLEPVGWFLDSMKMEVTMNQVAK